MRQDSLRRAEELFRSALGVDQDFVEANYNLTEVYLRQGQVERALDEVRGIVKRTPSNPKAYAFLAYVYEHGVEGKRYGIDYRAADAIKTYQFALLLTPNDPLLHYNLGVIHGRLGDLGSSASGVPPMPRHRFHPRRSEALASSGRGETRVGTGRGTIKTGYREFETRVPGTGTGYR